MSGCEACLFVVITLKTSTLHLTEGVQKYTHVALNCNFEVFMFDTSRVFHFYAVSVMCCVSCGSHDPARKRISYTRLEKKRIKGFQP